MKALLTSIAAFIVAASSAFAAADPQPVSFDHKQLSGWWAESHNTDLVCGPQSLRMTMKIDLASNRFEVQFEKKWKSALGDVDRIGAKIVSSTQRTLVIQYDNEARKKKNGQPMEWELAVVAPGVYRWRETDWPRGAVNSIVGIRCSE